MCFRRRHWQLRQRLKQALTSTTNPRRMKNKDHNSFLSILHEPLPSPPSKSASHRRSVGGHHYQSDGGGRFRDRRGLPSTSTPPSFGTTTINAGYRACTSWQRVRPLPMLQQSPLDEGPSAVASPSSGPQQLLLSPISLGFSGGGGRDRVSSVVA